jgi:hypothetical protein
MQIVERKKEQNLAIDGSRATSTLKTSKVHIMLTISSLWISPSFAYYQRYSKSS